MTWGFIVAPAPTFWLLGVHFGSCLYFWGPLGSSLAPLGAILATLGLHFDVFLALWSEPGPPAAPHSQKLEQVAKMQRLGSPIGSLLGHIFGPFPPKVEPATVLSSYFVSLFSKAFLAALEAGF